MSNCWEGFASREEEERENDWIAPSDLTDGDLPWAPNPVEKPQPYLDRGPEWVAPTDGEDPLYDLLKRDADDEDGA